MRLRSRQGQGLIETLVCLPLVILFVGTVGLLSYRAVVYHATVYHLHEALICHSDKSIDNCQRELEKRLQSFLFRHTKIEIHLNSKGPHVHGAVVVYLQPVLRVEDSMKQRLL